MILADQNEPPDMDFLLQQMGIEVQRGSYNKTTTAGPSYPDYMCVNGEPVGVSRKQATEIMGDIDAVEEQLSRELLVCGKLVLLYEGNLTYHPDGVFAGDSESRRVETHKTRKGEEYEVLTSWGRVFRQPFARWVKFVYNLQDRGIPVVPTGNMQGSAVFLHKLHEGHANTLFTRLIPVRQQLLEVDLLKRDWLLSLMSIPGVAEQAARGIEAVIPNEYQLIMFLAEGGRLADLVMPSGRRIGPALERRIRQFKGVPQHTEKKGGA